MTDTRTAPAHIVLLDDIDEADLSVTPALCALRTLVQLIEMQPEGLDIGSRSLAPLLHCIGETAFRGWPLPTQR